MDKKSYEATLKALKETTERVTQSQETAREYLQDLGIINPDNTLTKEYGGTMDNNEITSTQLKRQFEEYDEGYNLAKEWAEEQLIRINQLLQDKPDDFKDGYFDAINDILYFF